MRCRFIRSERVTAQTAQGAARLAIVGSAPTFNRQTTSNISNAVIVAASKVSKCLATRVFDEATRRGQHAQLCLGMADANYHLQRSHKQPTHVTDERTLEHDLHLSSDDEDNEDRINSRPTAKQAECILRRMKELLLAADFPPLPQLPPPLPQKRQALANLGAPFSVPISSLPAATITALRKRRSGVVDERNSPNEVDTVGTPSAKR